MNNHEQIIAVLTKIKDNQQKIKVKTSKYLKQLDIFKMQLSPQDIRLLLLGNEQLPYGLLYCIGNKSKVGGSLRKSAFYTAELFLSLMEKHSQSKDFVKIFADLEDDDYKLLALSTHVLDDMKLHDRGLVAFKIIKCLKDERPHFNLEYVLEMKKLQEMFINWYKTMKVQQIQEQIQQTSWKDSDAPIPENINIQREQNKRQKKLEHITLEWDGNPEYLIKTFYNPFIPQQRTTKSNKQRDAALKKKQIAESLNAVIDTDIVQQLQQTIKNLDKVIVKIHLDSPQFDAQTFLKIIQPNLNSQSMDNLIEQNNEMNKNIVYYFIDDFFCINQGILQIQNEFISKEFKDSQRRKKQLSQNEKFQDPVKVDEILILGSVQKRTFQLLSKLNIISDSMNQLRQRQQNIKSVLDFIRKCEQYVQLPYKLKESFLQRDTSKIMKLLALNKDNIEQYQNISLFKNLNQQISQVIQQIYSDMLQQIKKEGQDFNKLLETAEYILELNKTNGKDDLLNNFQDSIISNFNQVFNKFQKQSNNQAYLIENLKGDFITEFLQQCSNISKDLSLINCKALEIFINGKFNDQVKLYLQLCRSLNLNQNTEKVQLEITTTIIEFLTQIETIWFSQNYSKLVCLRINQDLDSIKSMLATLSNLFDNMENIKAKLNDIEIKALSKEFVNYTLQQINIVFTVPQKDFFGVGFSDWMLQVFDEILKICNHKNVDGLLYMELLQHALTYISQKCVTPTDRLIFLHNMKSISNQIKDLAQNVYQNSKKQISFKEFAEPIQKQINPLVAQFYQPTLQAYVKSLDFQMLQQLDIVPRPYIIQWLSLLNEQAVILAQLDFDKIITDSIISYIISLCFKNIESSIQNQKKNKLLEQLNQEIALLQTMTLNFQGSISQDGFIRLQRKLDELSQGTLTDPTEWARNQKFKMSFNFKALYERILTARCEQVKPESHQFEIEIEPENSLEGGFDFVWKEKSLKIFCNAIKFIVKMKKAVDQRHLRKLTHRIYDIIGDNASSYQFFQLKGLVSSKWTYLNYIQMLITNNISTGMNFGVIKPDGKLKLLIDCTILIVIVLNIFYIPMQLSFSLQDNAQDVDFFFSTIPSWIFVAEILVNFNTAYYQKGMIHENRTKIFQNYIKGDFAKDLLVVIPFLISQYNIPYLNFVLLLRITKVNKIVSAIEEITLIREKFAAPIDVLKLFIFLIFVAHVSGCAWHYIGIQEDIYNNTGWIVKYGYNDEIWIIRYVASLYFGTVTSFTVGFGDIVPQTVLEQIFLIIMILITSLVFGYAISSIQTIFGQLREKTDQHRNKMAKVNSYMKKHKISPILQIKIRKYFEYFFTVQDSPEQLMDNLNDDLKAELKSSIYMPVLKQCNVFKQFNEQLLYQLCQIVQIQRFIPGQTIIQEKEQINKAYFIIQGEIDILINKIQIQQQNNGSFAINEFFFQKPIHFSVKATQFTEIAFITYEDFIQLIRNSQNNLEQYYQLKDNILYNKKEEKCQICSGQHNLLNCQIVFYAPQVEKIVTDNSDDKEQPRFISIRKKNRSTSALIEQQFNIVSAIDFSQDNELLNEAINDSVLKRLGYINQELKQSSLQEDKIKSLKLIQLFKQKAHQLDQTKGQRIKKLVLKDIVKKVESQHLIQTEINQLETLRQEFIKFKKDGLNSFDSYSEFQSYHNNENISNVLKKVQRLSRQFKSSNGQFFSKIRFGKTKNYNVSQRNLIQSNFNNK